MVKDAKVGISKYNASMKGTGGGPSNVWKNLVFKKIYEQAIGRNNPSVPGGQILGGVESETSERILENSTIALVERECEADYEYTLVDLAYEDIHVIQLSEENDGAMSFSIDVMQSSSVTPLTSCSSTSPTAVLKGKTTRKMISAAKKTLCNDSILSSGKRFLKDRVELLNVMMRVRRNLGKPMENSEIPNDLFKAINNIKDYC